MRGLGVYVQPTTAALYRSRHTAPQGVKVPPDSALTGTNPTVGDVTGPSS